jgi:hypothetical protein
MKLYTPTPQKLMRVNITRQGNEPQHITLCECGQQEVFDFCKAIIEKQGLSIFCTGKVTQVQVREAEGGKNGKGISFSFKGLSPREVHDLFINELQKTI